MKIMKLFQKYILIVSLFMLFQTGMMFCIDFAQIGVTKKLVSIIGNRLFTFLFYFSYYNIILVFVAGIFFLFEKERRNTGLLALISLAAFIYLIHRIGNGF